MVKDAREQRPPIEEDRDQVDFTWLTSLFRRLGRRIFPDPAVVPPEEEEDPTVTEAAPGAAQALPGTAPTRPAEPQPLATPTEPTAEVRTVEPEADAATEAPTEAPTEPAPAPAPAPTGMQAAIIAIRRSMASRASQQGSSPWKYGVPLALAFLVGVVSMKTHFGGVDWGDDFALYLRQAKALNVGNVGEVLSQTRFTVDNSGWSSFSPYSYPWGWPLLMAPVYFVFGLDYGALKFLEVLALCVFLLAFFAIVRRRAGMVPATLLTALIGVSRAFNGSTDSVLSDLPYLCFAGLCLWWMDRCRERGLLTVDRSALVILGLLVAFTKSIRREGIVLLFVVVALHVAILAGVAVRSRSVRALRTVDWKKVALPYLTFFGAVVGMQLVLPSALKPDVPGAGLANIRPHLKFYQDVVAEHVGLKDPGVPMRLFHSQPAARFALAVLLILAVVGLITRLVYRFEEDVHLAAFLVGSTFIMLVSPFQESRYLFTITPFLLYFAFQAIPTVAALGTSPNPKLLRIAAIPPAIAALGLALLCGGDLAHALDYHRHYHYTVNGPELPDARQMFTVVKEVTRGDDVILFARARAMSLYTDRLAIQGSNLDQLLPRSDWYVMEKGSTYSQTLLTDAEAATRRLTKAWENGSWVIWKVPPRGL